ncbi:hypothetical protein D3C71_1662540 [compost metagenome]
MASPPCPALRTSQSISRFSAGFSVGCNATQSRITRHATAVAPATLKCVPSALFCSGTNMKYGLAPCSPSPRIQRVELSLRSISATCSRVASAFTAWVYTPCVSSSEPKSYSSRATGVISTGVAPLSRASCT